MLEIPDMKNTSLLGETDDGENVVVPVYLHRPRPKNKSYRVKWFAAWMEDAEGTGMSLVEMAADKRLNLTDFRVRDYLFCKLGLGNFVHISQTEAADRLGIDQSDISRSVKKLIELGIILQGPSKGKFKTYQVNPAIAYFGSIDEGIKERKKAIGQGKATVLTFPSCGCTED